MFAFRISLRHFLISFSVSLNICSRSSITAASIFCTFLSLVLTSSLLVEAIFSPVPAPRLDKTVFPRVCDERARAFLPLVEQVVGFEG